MTTTPPSAASGSAKIEACPLCGAKPVVWDAAGHEVDCSCGLNYCNKTDPSRAAAIAGWNKRAAIEQDGEPVAYMFHVRYDGKGKSSWFAAIDYTVQVGETLISKEPLYTRPATDAAKDARIAELEALYLKTFNDCTRLLCSNEELRQQLAEQGEQLTASRKETKQFDEESSRLAAEITRLKGEVVELRKVCDEQAARLVAANRNAARYAFIKASMQVGAVQTQLPLYRVLHWHGFEECSDKDDKDAVIDAAIASTGEKL